MDTNPFEIIDRESEQANPTAGGVISSTARLTKKTFRATRVFVTSSVVRGRWHAVTSVFWLLLASSLWVAATVHESWSPAVLPLWLLSFHSLGLVLGMPFLLAVPGRLGWVLRCITYPTICLSLIWLVASVTMFKDRGQHLLWEELVYRLGDPPSRTFILSLLMSWPTLLFVVGFTAIASALHWLHRPLRRNISITIALALIVVSQVGGIIVLGTNSAGGSDYFVLKQQPTCAPWCWVHRHIHRFDDGPPPKPDLKAAAAFRHDFTSPLWAQGPDLVLAPLANRYPRRNVVVLLLESQRLAEIAPHGAGAWKHHSLSPNLTALCERGLFLSNYVQSGPGTFFARFSLATGLPGLSSFTINGCPEGIDLALGGPLADFVANNYRCEWMQAADPAFSGWDRYLSRINVAGWIQGAELAHAHENKDGWTSWGMPDEQLLDIAWNRYRHHLDQPEAPPYLLAVLTVSNHSPYSFPKTAGRLPLSHDGGMQYADACLGIFVKRLLSLPEAQRPVLLITGDHSHRDDLSGATPIGPEGLEGVRIPGLLITPDAYAAGQVCTTPFVHEDALDLMLLLVGQTATDKPRKFIDAHRIAATSVNGSGMSIMSEQGFFSAQLDAAYERQGTWGLIPASKEVQQALHAAKGAIDAAMSRMWTH